MPGLQQPGQRAAEPRQARRGDPRVREGIGNPARLRGSPQQPRHRSPEARQDRRGDHPLPAGVRNPARIRRRPYQPWQRRSSNKGVSRRQSSPIGNSWNSGPATRSSTTTWASFWPTKGGLPRQSPLSRRPWKSSLTTRTPAGTLSSPAPNSNDRFFSAFEGSGGEESARGSLRGGGHVLNMRNLLDERGGSISRRPADFDYRIPSKTQCNARNVKCNPSEFREFPSSFLS